jgi:hypothetical protein
LLIFIENTGFLLMSLTKYTSKILKATALLDDTKVLFSCWDDGISVKQNLQKAKEENIFGKTSRSRVKDILNIFRQRYLLNSDLAEALSVLVKQGFLSESLNLIFYFYSARADSLIFDTVIEILLPMSQIGQNEIHTDEILERIRQWVREGKTETEWSEKTSLRAVQGLLATLRDFGILQGTMKKKISPVYLPVKTFAFIAFQLFIEKHYGEKMLTHPVWRLFFLYRDAVERFFIEAHQEKLLYYYAAGSVIRIEFPVNTLKEYACALT